MIQALLIRKTHLELSRVNVDIDLVAVNIQVQQRKRIAVLHQEAVIAILDSFRDDIIFHKTVVDEVILKIPVAAGGIRIGDETVNVHDL